VTLLVPARRAEIADSGAPRDASGSDGQRAVPAHRRSNSTSRPSSGFKRVRSSWEPWRDWFVLCAASQGILVVVAVLDPGRSLVLGAGFALGVVWATGTLTVLHDAGHRRFGRRSWPNVLAVQTAVPVGLWVAHWAVKHRVHHRLTQVYPYDEPTRSSGLVRLHPEADWRPAHRYQHLYAWFLYGLAWVGELRSQLTYLQSGRLAGESTPTVWRRVVSFTAEKLLCLLMLAAVVTAVGHINVGVAPEPGSPSPDQWIGHVVRTTASFRTASPAVRWMTGAMTHHLAHHLRPVAPRVELPAVHRDVVPAVAARAGLNVVEFSTLSSAIRGHWRRLRELGQPGGVAVR
jgi:linoleoyl-CoA desaturase